MIRKTKNVQFKHYLVLILLFIIITFIYNAGIHSYASSASIGFSSKDSNTTVGNRVEVALTVRSSANIGDFEAYVSYDPKILEFKEGGAYVAGGDGLLKISDINTTDGQAVKKYVITFKAIDAGACEIKVKDKASIFDFDEGSEMSVSSNQVSINVNATKVASTNVKLESLRLSPGTLSPSFDSNVDQYTVNVENETKSIIISANPQDKKSKVTVLHADNLVEGENKVQITVKAEAGNTKEYAVIVNRAKSEKSSSDNEEEEQSNSNNEKTDTMENTKEQEGKLQTVIHAVNIDGNIVLNSNSSYRIIEVPEDVIIPNGYMKTKIKIDKISIIAYTPKNNLESDYLLIYAKNEEGAEQFYQYDRVEQTLQRYQKDKLMNNIVEGSEKTISIEKFNNKKNQLTLVIIILIASNILSILIIIRLIMKKKGYNDDLDL